jgi:DNA-binding transcriptional MocR family regulator
MTTSLPSSGLFLKVHLCNSGLVQRRVSAARAATLLDPLLGDGPAYAAIAEGLRRLISDGRIPLGAALPSERELTSALGVSRTTVTRAYASLKDAGFLEARQGSGSLARLPDAARAGDALLNPGLGADPSFSGGAIGLSCAAPATPPGVAAAYDEAVRQLPGYLHGVGYFPTGLHPLREAIAARYTRRGLPTEADQVIVTSGALSALVITLTAFARTGARALVESPTYPNAIGALRQAGLRLAGADVTEHGWASRGGSVTDTVRQVRPALAYLMPDWHNPTGLFMGDEQRAEVARALRSARTLTIVDETMVELSIDADNHTDALPFAAHLPQAITLGSASKAYWGGLRLGWIRAPRERIAELLRARLVLDLGTPVVDQLALVHLMGSHDEVLAVRREQLADSRAALVSALTRRLPSWSFRVPAGGLSLWCELPRPASTALVVAAERHGVRLAPGPLFAPEGGLERFLRVPYTLAAADVPEAVDRVAAAWDDLEARGRRTSRRRAAEPVVV